MHRIRRALAAVFAVAWLAGIVVITAPHRAEALDALSIDAAVDDTLREFSWQIR